MGGSGSKHRSLFSGKPVLDENEYVRIRRHGFERSARSADIRRHLQPKLTHTREITKINIAPRHIVNNPPSESARYFCSFLVLM